MPRAGPRRVNRYDLQFKLNAVELSKQPGVQVQDVAASLCIHPFMLSRWRKQVADGVLVGALMTDSWVVVSCSPEGPWAAGRAANARNGSRNRAVGAVGIAAAGLTWGTRVPLRFPRLPQPVAGVPSNVVAITYRLRHPRKQPTKPSQEPL